MCNGAAHASSAVSPGSVDQNIARLYVVLADGSDIFVGQADVEASCSHCFSCNSLASTQGHVYTLGDERGRVPGRTPKARDNFKGECDSGIWNSLQARRALASTQGQQIVTLMTGDCNTIAQSAMPLFQDDGVRRIDDYNIGAAPALASTQGQSRYAGPNGGGVQRRRGGPEVLVEEWMAGCTRSVISCTGMGP